MKTGKCTIALFAGIFLLMPGCFRAYAQDETGYITVSGIVKDAKNRKKLEYVNISAIGTHIGTVSNEEGKFTLKISKALHVSEIEFSCIGYFNARVTISGDQTQERTFLMTPKNIQLNEVEISGWKDPRDLVQAAIRKVDANYSLNPNLMTGFYRETIQKRRKYINLSEAVIHIYKSGYTSPPEHDRVQILKGRKLISQKASDTLGVKLLGGPTMGIYVDIVKNRDVLLEEDMLLHYLYKMGEMTSVNDRLQYVVHFSPRTVLPYPLYSGTFYIDRETLSFSRAEFSMDMSDKIKVSSIILKGKPVGLRFSPEEVTYTVAYKYYNGKTYLNYVRNEIRFKCDWKRRLFATNYSVIGETVITDNQEDSVPKILNRESFSLRQSLSQEVSAYYDEDFWGAYNIIEPTESLENAVGRLKKQQKYEDAKQ